jgi:hypothetical protein
MGEYCPGTSSISVLQYVIETMRMQLRIYPDDKEGGYTILAIVVSMYSSGDLGN